VPKRGKLTKRTRNRTIIAGIRKHPEAFEQGLGADKLTAEQIIARLEEHLRVLDDIDRYDKLKSESIVREATMEEDILDLWFLIRLRAQSHFGPESPKVGDFFMKRRKKPKIDVATKAVAVAKRRATRKVRRTMGKRQRKNIKGW
jgi:hypothetical protein